MGAGDAFRLLREHPRSFDSLWFSHVSPPRSQAVTCDIDAILSGQA